MNRAELSGATAMAAQSEKMVADTFAALESRNASESTEDLTKAVYVEQLLPLVDFRASHGNFTAIFTVPVSNPEAERIMRQTSEQFRADGYTPYQFRGSVDTVLGPKNIMGLVVSWPHPLRDKD